MIYAQLFSDPLVFAYNGCVGPVGDRGLAGKHLVQRHFAFTTSFAFSPTDTLPLTRRAKMLMLLQATISIITLTGIAGSAINILASSG